METTDYDGWGRVIHQMDANGAQVNTNYDNMGRVASKTNPFAAGGSPSYSTSYGYDVLGRATTVTLPDTQTVTTSYSGASVTLTDQVNRKTQRLTDGLGRLVAVNEQDSSGNLTQATNYRYDYLNGLTQVDQGGQLRKYKYDALSRLLYEKIPEQTASINDGTGAYWTSKYTYTDFNGVSTRTDARGVVTSNGYAAALPQTLVGTRFNHDKDQAPLKYYWPSLLRATVGLGQARGGGFPVTVSLVHSHRLSSPRVGRACRDSPSRSSESSTRMCLSGR